MRRDFVREGGGSREGSLGQPSANFWSGLRTKALKERSQIQISAMPEEAWGAVRIRSNST